MVDELFKQHVNRTESFVHAKDDGLFQEFRGDP